MRERRWTASEPGKSYTIRLMVHSNDSDADLDRYAAMAERVYRQHAALWGDLPDHEGGTYTFLADYVPYATGDGMEHRNSTYIPSTQSLAEGNFGQIQTLSHELFHAWNVERLRPAELEPFDFTRANPTGALWFAEGFTSYYGPLTIRRAGITPRGHLAGRGVTEAVDSCAAGDDGNFVFEQHVSISLWVGNGRMVVGEPPDDKR